jgi:hypothetical protein
MATLRASTHTDEENAPKLKGVKAEVAAAENSKRR